MNFFDWLKKFSVKKSEPIMTDKYSIYDNQLKINNNLVDFYNTPNKGGVIKPKFLVIHYTAGSSDAKGTGEYFQRPSAKASAHLTLDVDGTIIQSVKFNKKAWHAGRSTWAGYSGLNSHSIGIEVINPGPLTITNSGYTSWFGKTYTNSDIIEAPHQNNPNGEIFGWIPFSEKQVDVLIELGNLLMDHYKLDECVGHDMISPGRKTDPGPCMNYRVYDKINGSRTDKKETVWYVEKVVNYLNGRSGPSTMYDVIDRLDKGTEVDIIKREGSWWFVETPTGQEVWVASRFLGTK